MLRLAGRCLQRATTQGLDPPRRKSSAVQLPSFKMSDRSLFAVLLRSPWWISFVVAIGVGAACFSLFPAKYAAVGAISGLPFAVIGGIAAWRQWRAPSPKRIEATLQTLSAMPAREFVDTLAAAYRHDGYTVTRTNGVADLSLEKAGRKQLVSCKRWKAAAHGVEPLRELATAAEAAEASLAIYVAVNAVSDAARQFASRNSIRFLNGEDLALLVQKTPAQR